MQVFRGIPYAAPPVAALRFQPPSPVEPWTGVRDARRYGYAAPQTGLGWLRSLGLGAPRSDEDCLTLNVWTPSTQGRRPVLVWIHGGGFMLGSAGQPPYDSRRLARRGNVVVVTLNYRLGALGFVDLSRVCRGPFERASNLGLRDQIAALAWVRDNIAAFGGDPHNVTVFGESAGAMSVGALLASPAARGLFGRAILQSGAAEHVHTPGAADAVARSLLEELGLAANAWEELRHVPVARLLLAQGGAMRRHSGYRRLMGFQPSIDGDVLPQTPLEAIRAGSAADVEIVVGSNLDEWRLFRFMDTGSFSMDELALVERVAGTLPELPGDPHGALEAYRGALLARGASRAPWDVWAAFQSARVFHVPVARLAEAQASAGGTAYAYLFTWRTPVLRRQLGACHALELPFVFGWTQHPIARPLTGLTSSARRLSVRMQGAWTSFARSGQPAHRRLPPWPRYTKEDRHTMVLGRRCYVDPAPLEDERLVVESWGLV